jgi:uncharacterized membrane protein YqaE (UPF0057 family)
VTAKRLHWRLALRSQPINQPSILPSVSVLPLGSLGLCSPRPTSTMPPPNVRPNDRYKVKPKRHHAYTVFIFVIGFLLPPFGESPWWRVACDVRLVLTLNPAVAARFGVGKDFWINVLLTICGYVPGEHSLVATRRSTLIPPPHRPDTQLLHSNTAQQQKHTTYAAVGRPPRASRRLVYQATQEA